MIDKETITSVIARLTHGRKKTFVKQTIHPKREWFLGLGLFVLIIIGGGIMSAYTFLKYSALHQNVVGNADTGVLYKENTVKKALTLFSEKKKLFEGVQSNSTPGDSQKEVVELIEDEQEVPAPNATSTPPVQEETPTEEGSTTTSALPEVGA